MNKQFVRLISVLLIPILTSLMTVFYIRSVKAEEEESYEEAQTRLAFIFAQAEKIGNYWSRKIVSERYYDCRASAGIDEYLKGRSDSFGNRLIGQKLLKFSPQGRDLLHTGEHLQISKYCTSREGDLFAAGDPEKNLSLLGIDLEDLKRRGVKISDLYRSNVLFVRAVPDPRGGSLLITEWAVPSSSRTLGRSIADPSLYVWEYKICRITDKGNSGDQHREESSQDESAEDHPLCQEDFTS